MRYLSVLLVILLLCSSRDARAQGTESFGYWGDKILKEAIDGEIPQIMKGWASKLAGVVRELGVEVAEKEAWSYYVYDIAARAKDEALRSLSRPDRATSMADTAFAESFEAIYRREMAALLDAGAPVARETAFKRIAAAMPEIVKRLGKRASASIIGRAFRAGALVYGLQILLRILDIYLLYEVGTTSYEAGKAYSENILKEQDLTEALEAQAVDSEAYNALMDRLVWAIKSGRLKLIDGVQLDDCSRIILDNLDAGRAPYEGVFEPRKPLVLTGPWSGEIHVKDVQGPSNIDLNEKPPALQVTAQNFEVKQDGFYVTFRCGASEISGYVYGDGTALLADKPTGNITWAKLVMFGPKDGSLNGRLQVEFHQQNTQGGTVIRGGLLEPAR